MFEDDFTRAAIEDQKKADYPNCVKGLMHCRYFCGNECPATSAPTIAFVTARAETLRKRANCKHEHTAPKFSTLFESLGQRGEICVTCDLVRDTPEGDWHERID